MHVIIYVIIYKKEKLTMIWNSISQSVLSGPLPVVLVQVSSPNLSKMTPISVSENWITARSTGPPYMLKA